MPRKPAHQQFDTLKAIQDAAFELFGRYGYDGVSIGQIASASDISKGALYWHFPGKEALYLNCLKRVHAIFDEYIFNRIRTESDPVNAIIALFTGAEKMLADPRIEKGIAGYWLVPSGPGTVIFADAQRQYERAAMGMVREVLQRGVEQGRFDFGNDMDEMARAIIILVDAVALPLRYMTAAELRPTLSVLARTLFRAYTNPQSPVVVPSQTESPSLPTTEVASAAKRSGATTAPADAGGCGTAGASKKHEPAS